MTSAAAAIFLLPKLTIEAMGCNPSRAKDQSARIPLCLIIGLIDREERRTHSIRPNRTFMVLRGRFYGKNLENNVEFESWILQMPDSIRRQIVRFGTKTEQLEFAVTIFSEPATNPTGYRYVVHPLWL